MIIYKITNKINGKVYVGQTTMSVAYRWKRHCARGHALFKAIKKHGQENFIVEELVSASTLENLNFLESYFIKYFNSLSPQGYNLNTGGDRFQVSEETKAKLSASHVGKPAPWNSYKRSPETIKRMSEISTGRQGYWTGKNRLRNTLRLKPVVDLTTGIVYDCGVEAAEALGVSKSHISVLAKKGQRLAFVESFT